MADPPHEFAAIARAVNGSTGRFGGAIASDADVLKMTGLTLAVI
ncbi:hypothetical protein [Nannocystis exedens]|nr:hypothetical protein [Nannocystis exedens]